MISIMKNYKTIIRMNHTQQLHFIIKLLDIKDLIIFRFMEAINLDIRKEIIAKLDYDTPTCPDSGNQLRLLSSRTITNFLELSTKKIAQDFNNFKKADSLLSEYKTGEDNRSLQFYIQSTTVD